MVWWMNRGFLDDVQLQKLHESWSQGHCELWDKVFISFIKKRKPTKQRYCCHLCSFTSMEPIVFWEHELDFVLVEEIDEVLSKFQCCTFFIRGVWKISSHDVPDMYLLLNLVDFNKRYNVTTEWPFYRNFFNYLFNFKPQFNPQLAKGRSYFQ